MATKGLLAKKIGMTQGFTEKGELLPGTLLQAGPCGVIALRAGDPRLAQHQAARFDRLLLDALARLQGDAHGGSAGQCATDHVAPESRAGGPRSQPDPGQRRRPRPQEQRRGGPGLDAPAQGEEVVADAKKTPATVYDPDREESGPGDLPEAVFNAPVNPAGPPQGARRQPGRAR